MSIINKLKISFTNLENTEKIVNDFQNQRKALEVKIKEQRSDVEVKNDIYIKEYLNAKSLTTSTLEEQELKQVMPKLKKAIKIRDKAQKAFNSLKEIASPSEVAAFNKMISKVEVVKPITEKNNAPTVEKDNVVAEELVQEVQEVVSDFADGMSIDSDAPNPFEGLVEKASIMTDSAKIMITGLFVTPSATEADNVEVAGSDQIEADVHDAMDAMNPFA
ncbi:MAG: hypothetical protein DGJ47_000940 [Rickettsiaceae bacterium]